MRIEADGSISAPVRIPLARPITGTFFTATPRAGNPLTEAADLLIADTIDGQPVARYARIRFSRGNVTYRMRSKVGAGAVVTRQGVANSHGSGREKVFGLIGDRLEDR